MSDVDALIAKIESLTPAQAARRRDAYLKVLHDSRGSLRLLKSMFIMIAGFEPLSWAADDADGERENDEDSHALVDKLLDCTSAAMTAAKSIEKAIEALDSAKISWDLPEWHVELRLVSVRDLKNQVESGLARSTGKKTPLEGTLSFFVAPWAAIRSHDLPSASNGAAAPCCACRSSLSSDRDDIVTLIVLQEDRLVSVNGFDSAAL